MVRVYQEYIKCDDYYLFSCSYIPQNYDKIVLLLQGYSHSMTDIDYFMTNVKNELLKHNCAVVQFDPLGHGDSDGYIEYFNYNVLIQNIKSVVDWIKKHFNQEIVFVARGLYTLVIKDKNVYQLFKKCIALNALSISPTELCEIRNWLINKANIEDFNKWFNGIPDYKKDYMECLLYSMGAKLKNLQGQYINKSYFLDFIDRLADVGNAANKEQSYIFSTDKDEIVLDNMQDMSIFNAEYYYKYGALPRDPDWHFNVINTIVSMCT